MLQTLTGSRGQEFLHNDTNLPLIQQRMAPMCGKNVTIMVHYYIKVTFKTINLWINNSYSVENA